VPSWSTAGQVGFSKSWKKLVKGGGPQNKKGRARRCPTLRAGPLIEPNGEDEFLAKGRKGRKILSLLFLENEMPVGRKNASALAYQISSVKTFGRSETCVKKGQAKCLARGGGQISMPLPGVRPGKTQRS